MPDAMAPAIRDRLHTLDRESRPATFLGDLAVLLHDEAARRLVALETAEDLIGHPAIGTHSPTPTDQGKQYRWAIYHITGTPAKLLGHVEAPDEESAIKRAIEEFNVTPQLQKLLLALRR
jgi:hypothetical protein